MRDNSKCGACLAEQREYATSGENAYEHISEKIVQTNLPLYKHVAKKTDSQRSTPLTWEPFENSYVIDAHLNLLKVLKSLFRE